MDKVRVTLYGLIFGVILVVANLFLVELPYGIPIVYSAVPILVFCMVIGLLPAWANRDVYSDSPGGGSVRFNTFMKLSGIFQLVISLILSLNQLG